VALTHAADACDSGADLGSAELEARRTQQLVDWGTLLVQAAATVAAERVLLGPAAPPVSQAGLEWWFGMAGLGSLLLLYSACVSPGMMLWPACLPACLCLFAAQPTCVTCHPRHPPLVLQEGAALAAAELPISVGQRPPSSPAARCAAIQAQVAAAVGVLEQQRQLKLGLLAQAEAKAQQSGAAAGLPAAERCLLAAEAAADLEAQALLAHWGIEVAAESRRLEALQQQEQAGAAVRC
jgi:hypothetical protein